MRMYGAVASTAVCAEAAALSRELRLALEEQLRELMSVRARLSEARLLVPVTAEDWRGPAQFFYGLALLRLTADLDAAHEELDLAIRETRLAADSLGDRVG